MPNLKLYRKGSGKNSEFISILPIGTTFLAEEKTITVSVTSTGTTNFTGSNFAGTGKSVKSEASYEVEQSHTFDLCNCEFSKTYPFTYQATYQRVCSTSPPPPEEAEWEELSETVDVEGGVTFTLERLPIGYGAIGYRVVAFVFVQGLVGGNPPYYPNCFAFPVLWFGLSGRGGDVTCTDKNFSDQQEIITNWAQWFGVEGWSGESVETITVNVSLE